jgi:hypothetical protein
MATEWIERLGLFCLNFNNFPRFLIFQERAQARLHFTSWDGSLYFNSAQTTLIGNEKHFLIFVLVFVLLVSMAPRTILA